MMVDWILDHLAGQFVAEFHDLFVNVIEEGIT
jgi:hypothetical protein